MRYKVYIPTGQHKVFYTEAKTESEAIDAALRQDAQAVGYPDAPEIEYTESSDCDPPFATLVED